MAHGPCRDRAVVRRRLAPGLLAFLALLQPFGETTLEARAWRRPLPIRPAVWRVADRDTTLYLFGTIHALPPHFEWETPALRKVIASSQRLILEAVIDRDDPTSAQALLKLGAASGPIPPLSERVPKAQRIKLVQMAGKAGVPLTLLDKLKTWTAAMVLFGVTVQGLGVSGADGVEEQLKTEFREKDKPVEGLETLEEQLSFFDQLTEPQQRAFLESVLEDDADDAADFGKMLGAWSHGDERGIQRSFDKDMKATEALQDVLIARRNARWADLLAERMKKPGTSLVAVGAGHLVGPQSVQAMLAKRGYRARRVE
jgi:uncharacterized protein